MRFSIPLSALGLAAAMMAACSSSQQGAPALPATIQSSSAIPSERSARFDALPLVKQANWSQPGYDSAHTGFNPLEKILGPTNVNKLAVGFSFAAANGILVPVVMSKNVLYADSSDGSLYAINAKTGAKLWAFTAGYGAWLQQTAVELGDLR